MNRNIVLVGVMVVAQFACTSKLPEVPDPAPSIPRAEAGSPAHPLVAKIAKILQPGWEVVQNGNTIVVAREKLVKTYTNVAMPPDAWRVLKDSPQTLRYEITIEIKALVPKPEYQRIFEANEKTRKELSFMTYPMQDFKTKDNFRPRNDREKELYEDYRRGLRELLFTRLPDLYDGTESFYITTALYPRSSFVYPREERECRAVLENVFSFANGYWDFTDETTEDERFQLRDDQLVDEVFRTRRDYDMYLQARENNLPEFR